MEHYQEKEQPQRDKDVAETVQEEPNDKPAARGIFWAIAIVIVVLAILYFFVFNTGESM